MISDYGGDFIIDRLTDNGFQAFYVGGCVRNFLLGIPINDYDITTNALPNQICEIFSDCNFFTTGIKHGTVSIVINQTVYEVTTFRKEGEYTDFRHPSKVDFCSDIHLDLSRRDFTINALAYNKNIGIIDDFKGFYDIQNRILRTVNDPYIRFNEDALRILRGIRFCSNYNLTVEENTKRQMIECANLLSNVSAERIFSELKGIILGDNFYNTVCDFKQVFFAIIPNLNKSSIDQKCLDFYFKALSNSEKTIEVRLALLLYACKNEAGNILKNLKCDCKTLKKVIQIIENLPIEEQLNDFSLKKLLYKLDDNCENLLYTHFALQTSYEKINNAKYAINQLKAILQSGECYKIKQLKINGDNLKEIGFSGKQIKKCLEFLLFAVMAGKVNNKKEDLLAYIKYYG